MVWQSVQVIKNIATITRAKAKQAWASVRSQAGTDNETIKTLAEKNIKNIKASPSKKEGWEAATANVQETIRMLKKAGAQNDAKSIEKALDKQEGILNERDKLAWEDDAIQRYAKSDKKESPPKDKDGNDYNFAKALSRHQGGNDARSQLFQGYLYSTRLSGGDKEPEQARANFEEALRLGLEAGDDEGRELAGEAALALAKTYPENYFGGASYSYDPSKESEYRKRDEYYKQAADLGNPQALARLGDDFFRKRDYTAAIEMYRKGANKGDATCARKAFNAIVQEQGWDLKYLQEDQIKTPRFAELIKFAKISADAGDREAQYLYADLLLKVLNPKEQLQMDYSTHRREIDQNLIKAADQGFEEAIKRKADMIFYSNNVEEANAIKSKAVTWAVNGSADAIRIVGKADPVQAKILYRGFVKKALEAGNIDRALSVINAIIDMDKNLAKDMCISIANAAKRDDFRAINKLAGFDFDAAVQWYQEKINKGDEKARYDLVALCVDNQQYDQALSALKDVNTVKAYRLLTTIYTSLGEQDKVTENYTKAANLEDVQSMLDLAERTKDRAVKKEWLTKAIAKDSLPARYAMADQLQFEARESNKVEDRHRGMLAMFDAILHDKNPNPKRLYGLALQIDDAFIKAHPNIAFAIYKKSSEFPSDRLNTVGYMGLVGCYRDGIETPKDTAKMDEAALNAAKHFKNAHYDYDTTDQGIRATDAQFLIDVASKYNTAREKDKAIAILEAMGPHPKAVEALTKLKIT